MNLLTLRDKRKPILLPRRISQSLYLNRQGYRKVDSGTRQLTIPLNGSMNKLRRNMGKRRRQGMMAEWIIAIVG